MATGILSHYRAGTGALCNETREESRLLRELLTELPEEAEVMTCAAPSGALRDARTGRTEQGQGGLNAGYLWAGAAPGRVLFVYDWHVLCNAPGCWRALIDALPMLRAPKGSEDGGNASLVVFVGPSFDLQSQNPLRGGIPVLSYAPPDRESIRDTLNRLHPLNGDGEACVDALCGLSADSAEQAAAEVLARTGGKYEPAKLRESKRAELRRAGLEVWKLEPELGGLSGFRTACETEVIPWLRDPQLSLRRILCAGLPGMGKSYVGKWLAHKIGAECVRLSIPAMKAGTVGASEGNLRRALAVTSGMAKHAPVVLVIDEIDTIARDGLDGGTSSGMFAELLTYLQEDTSFTVVVATLNRLDKLDAALESRFALRFVFELGTLAERASVAEIHYQNLGCGNSDIGNAALCTANFTEGFSSREIAVQVCPSVARRSGRKPTPAIIEAVCKETVPASRTQREQLKLMREAAATLRRANDPEEATPTGGRRIAKGNP